MNLNIQLYYFFILANTWQIHFTKRIYYDNKSTDIYHEHSQHNISFLPSSFQKKRKKGNVLHVGCTISFRVDTSCKSFKTAKEKVANVKM